LEDFLVRINTPIITTTTITFFNRVVFNIPQLFEFVNRTEALGPVKRVKLFFNGRRARLSVHRLDSPREGDLIDHGFLNVHVLCGAFDWKISFLVQICGQLSPLLSSVERLDIECEGIDPLDWQDDLDHAQWLEIFRPFISVQSLYIRGLDELIVPALQELTGVRVMEVLPALRSLFVTDPDPSGSVRQAIEPFISARHLSNHPITVRQSSDFTQARQLSNHPVTVRRSSNFTQAQQLHESGDESDETSSTEEEDVSGIDEYEDVSSDNEYADVWGVDEYEDDEDDEDDED
jgi:hypothetical protein